MEKSKESNFKEESLLVDVILEVSVQEQEQLPLPSHEHDEHEHELEQELQEPLRETSLLTSLSVIMLELSMVRSPHSLRAKATEAVVTRAETELVL